MRLFIFKAIVAGIVGLIVLHSYQVSGAVFIQISGVLLTVFLSIFLGLLCVPFLDSMNRKKIPDWAGMIIIYLVLFVLVGLFALAVYPILSEQFNELTGFITEQFKNLGDSQNPSARKIFSLLPESLREGQTNLWQVFRSNFNTVGESITTYI